MGLELDPTLVAWLRGVEPVGATEARNDAANPLGGVWTKNAGTEVSPRFGRCYSFDGSSNKIQSAAMVIDPSTTDLTVCCWFRIDQFTTTSQTITRQDETVSGTSRMWLYLANWSAAGKHKIATYLGGSLSYGTTVLSLGQWYHAAVVHNAGTVRLYLDGTEERSRVLAIEPADGSVLIALNNNGTHGLPGAIDDFRIYTRALQSSELAEVMKYRGPTIRRMIHA